MARERKAWRATVPNFRLSKRIAAGRTPSRNSPGRRQVPSRSGSCNSFLAGTFSSVASAGAAFERPLPRARRACRLPPARRHRTGALMEGQPASARSGACPVAACRSICVSTDAALTSRCRLCWCRSEAPSRRQANPVPFDNQHGFNRLWDRCDIGGRDSDGNLAPIQSRRGASFRFARARGFFQKAT